MYRTSASKITVAAVSLLILAAGVSVWNGGVPGVGEVQAQVLPSSSGAARSDVSSTRHNLSPNAPTRSQTAGNTAPPVGGTSTEPLIGGSGELCVFCHTPHGSNTQAAPLWNRAASVATYTGYSSSTLNAADLNVDQATLATPSKLCLSCHDGTIAIGSVSNAPGSGGLNTTMTLTGTATTPAGTMPFGRGQANAEHGFTRRLGTDLRNDHPIGFTYNDGVASADGELRAPSSSAAPSRIANQGTTVPSKPDFPLSKTGGADGGGRVQCSTCHDPHRNTQKFLLKNRLTQATGAAQSFGSWSFSDVNDQICVGCHTRLGRAWQQSAHADPTVANETYLPGPAAARDFPATPATAVWQAGCLNCHDTHTVSGSRRLLREGVKSALTTLSVGYTAEIRLGAALASGTSLNTESAIENTCYQCHSGGAPGPTSVVTPTALSPSEGVPNIYGEFARTYRMPITNAEQGLNTAGNATEVHEITNVNGAESQTALGYGVPGNRHVECTDCHNPHRVVKASTFLGATLSNDATPRRTHVPNRGTDGSEGNIASGALRGTWGVEPSYAGVTTATTWLSAAENPTFTVKQGDPGNATSLPIGKGGSEAVPYLTREYQLCFKCHSSYANGPLATDFPLLKTAAGRGGTLAAQANSLTRYTNVAAEFAVLANAPVTGEANKHQGEAGAEALTPTGATWDTTSGAGTINHRSWHPVVFPTGRTRGERRMSATGTVNMRPPWDSKMGTQTMHCSDCHGHSASYAQGSGPDLNQVQGPHGSDKPFLLKGDWDMNVRLPSPAATSLCGKCHNPGANGSASGFGGDHVPDDKMGGEACMYCHIAIPHGWKNKNFLVNLRCVGQEVTGTTGNCQDRGSGTYGATTIAPYYNQARLRISTWVASGGWNSSACGGSSMEDNCPRTG